ncbi:MAG: TIGR00266 family protein [Myxococcales bacterium]|nr:TIGR00266 family protein [Myxococcales bacterium]
MRHEILGSPDFTTARITFEGAGESVVAESGAMLAMTGGVQMKTAMRGGLLAAAKRKVMGGESLFQNTFTSTAPGQELLLAPAPEGDLKSRVLQPGEPFFLQSGAYVAHIGDDLKIDTAWGGAKGFFSGVGLFLLKIVGPGTVLYGSYGAIHAVEVDGTYVCDTGHIVGFTSGLQYRIDKFGGFKSLFLSGEGLVCNFSGQGTLLLQTRNPPTLANFLEPYRRVQKSNNND